LLSGGLDSTTVAAQAKHQGYELSAVTLKYGQTHERELQSASRVATILGIRHTIIDVSFYGNLAWYSSLTHPEQFAIPSGRTLEQMADDIPMTYVPMRNTFFLTLGAALLESQALALIEQEGTPPTDLEPTLLIAANAIDFSGYPDCRPAFYQTLTETLYQGSKLGSQFGIRFQIETPLIALSKAEIVELAIKVGAPLGETWSCYAGNSVPCGACDSCQLRAKGFAEAGVADPALGR